MIEMPRPIKRFLIKRNFVSDSKHFQALKRNSEVKKLLDDLEREVDIEIVDAEPNVAIKNDDIYVGWFGIEGSEYIKVEIVWEWDDGEFRNYIIATHKNGEEEALKKL